MSYQFILMENLWVEHFANWYGKLAPVVDRCFESQKHWIFAFFSSETEPETLSQKQSQTGSAVKDCLEQCTSAVVMPFFLFPRFHFLVQYNLSFIMNRLTVCSPRDTEDIENVDGICRLSVYKLQTLYRSIYLICHFKMVLQFTDTPLLLPAHIHLWWR